MFHEKCTFLNVLSRVKKFSGYQPKGRGTLIPKNEFKHTGGNCYELKQPNLANIENQKCSLKIRIYEWLLKYKGVK